MRLILPVLLGTITLLLSACNLGAAAPTINTPTPATTPVTVSSELTETVTGTDLTGGTLTVHYPSGWTSDAESFSSTITVFSSPDVNVLADGEPVPSGEIGMGISIITQALGAETFGVERVTASNIAGVYAGTLVNDGFEMNNPGTITHNGMPLVRLTGTRSEGDLILLLRDTPHGVIFLNAGVASGEIATHEPLLRDILASVTYEPVSG